ncbi:MAG TPA: phage holin family protein [Bacteroidales bacterium]
MEDKAKPLESLLNSATEYGKTSYELFKLKALDKTSNVVSSVVPHSIVLIILSSFMLFLNLGIALWLGEILGKIFYGFLIIAGFYLIIGVIIYFFLYKWLKKLVCNYVIKQMLK